MSLDRELLTAWRVSSWSRDILTPIKIFRAILNKTLLTVCFRRLIVVGRAVQWCHCGWKKEQKRAAKKGAGRDARLPSTRRAGTRGTWSAWGTWTGGAAARAASWAAGYAPPPRAPAGPSSASSLAFPSASSSSNTAPTSCRRIARPPTLHSTPASQRSYVSVSFLFSACESIYCF